MLSSDVGDLWVDTNDHNKMYRYSGTAWTNVQDTTVADNIYTANTTTIEGGKIRTGSIDASRINTVDLSSITANLGTVTAGKMQSSDGKFVVDLTNKFISISV